MSTRNMTFSVAAGAGLLVVALGLLAFKKADGQSVKDKSKVPVAEVPLPNHVPAFSKSAGQLGDAVKALGKPAKSAPEFNGGETVKVAGPTEWALGARSQSAYTQLLSAVAANDEGTVAKLKKDGSVIEMKSGTGAKIERKSADLYTGYFVDLLDGDHAGERVWISQYEAVSAS
jgi:hypothetical protein